MKLSRDAILMPLIVIFCLAAYLPMELACQCDRNTTTVKAAFCSSNYAFKGTVLTKHRVIIPVSTMKREESNQVSHSPSDMHAVEQSKYPDTETEEYHVLLETDYKGIGNNLVGQILVIYNDHSGCRHVSLEEGYTYVFQLDNLKLFDICDRVDLFGNISRLERRGLHKNYSRACKHQFQKRSESKRLKNALYMHSRHYTDRVKSEDGVKHEERGNYWQTVGSQPKPITKWDKKCKCHRPVYIKKTEPKLKKKDTK